MKVIFSKGFVISFLVIIFLIIKANCVYFSIHKDKPKCILEELYKGTVINIYFR
jgi:hypothetical protein